MGLMDRRIGQHREGVEINFGSEKNRTNDDTIKCRRYKKMLKNRKSFM